MSRYKVIVADNFHYQDADEHYTLGVFETAEEALDACRRIVEVSLDEARGAGGGTAEAIFRSYSSFGDDPFVVRLDPAAPQASFSAWNYARARAQELATVREG